MFSQAICNRAGWDKNWTDFKKKGGLQAVYKPPEGAGVSVWGGGGGRLDQYLGMGEPLRVWNPDPV